MLNSNYNKSKKAFGGVASTLIMFIAIIGVTTGMVMSFQNYFLQTKDTLNFQQKQTNEKLKTFISITHTYYDASSTTLRVYLKNTGSINVDTRFIDVFVDEGFRGNLTSYYAGTTNISKNLISAETIYIDYPVILVAGSHNVRVVTRVGVGDNVDFNVQ